MISIGNNIKSGNDLLQKATVKYLCDAIRHPKQTISARLRQLRIVKQINAAQYATLKQQLPYFVCAIFNPAYRRTENFAYTEYFIIDIDHLSDKGIVLEELRKRLTNDDRVLLCFASPSGDGLKVMMRLASRCYDSTTYKIFYRIFVERFSIQYNIQQVVDTKTCDVTRACFISEDNNIYFNPQCAAVRLEDIIDVENNVEQALQIKYNFEKENKEQKSKRENNSTAKEINDDALELIRKTLNPNAKLKKQKTPAYVPTELEEIMDELELYIAEKGIAITDIININYGKKLRFKIGSKQAEINLFFGKHGFSVVQSPRTGTDTEANALMADVVESFIVEKI
ncbi:MAG: CRISPR-associated primase-polymerase type B [Bacteroidales bacterium]|nr:CRISPR-associated primase-polymerase type B [Bacteroidales bacterium]MCM1147758.1 CRISPR-associated primase-polymerase type B [Bacteroidales bacterium]MCM1206632.1 CRISPR-associated primase-polymerase type B [Bacillota bacterium]MCM1510627.1 CRISPR-associated primase-polymerase type B [Clostridium sp.]